MSTGKLWGSLSTVVALVLAVVAFCAWGYVTLRHREEKQVLLYSISTRLKASDITDITRGPPRDNADSDDPVRPDDVVLDDQPPTKEMKDVARDIMTWCFLRWGGSFGARAGSDSTGVKLGIWNDRFENVRCAVMLLALRQVNASHKSKDPRTRSWSGVILHILVLSPAQPCPFPSCTLGDVQMSQSSEKQASYRKKRKSETPGD